ncbi:MAG: hypothetical protein AUK47_27505 [Deltaproteobacteria bacterium CG2_30_63_29]|nr:MAG: hypothetical protein AUK47_27505 [Deltaproteobacteria bacterium CG2_30_63_29]PIV98328.1 MAG: hypothetical protein COW42_15300 [Deltaproteobacteria bacterium CG17_big_fil_post_rev_8_21_14_2_50_63_7]PJB39849.1 MAG: hypothetical protein CO108_16245 [Deltaproteobacteria bacterium CG_4_9_14_3_um_filter_63_12]
MKLGLTILVLALFAVVGCDDAEVVTQNDVVNVDASDGTSSGDSVVADLIDTDVADTDVADVPADETGDAPQLDTNDPAPDLTDTTDACAQAKSALDSARDAAARTCERGSQCGTRYNSLCPEGGCYTHYVLGSDLSALDAAQSAYADANCGSGAVCDCAPAPEALACVGGHCETCPTQCPYTCNIDCNCYQDSCGCDQPFCDDGSATSCAELETRMQQAYQDARACVSDNDCVVTNSPICPELGCYLTFNSHAALGEVSRAVSAYTAAGCHMAECMCTPPPEGSTCVDGLCQ